MVDKVEEIPVLPIENGRGRYATPKIQSTQQLMNELAKGRKSGEEKKLVYIRKCREKSRNHQSINYIHISN